MAAPTTTVAVSPIDIRKLEVVSLEMPHSREEVMLGVSKNGALFRLEKFASPPSSFLASHAVIQDGSVYFVTPIDPLFLVLQIVDRQKGDVIDVRKCLESFGCNFLNEILEKNSNQLSCICDSKTTGEEVKHRLSDSKVLKWLSLKLGALLDALSSQQLPEFIKRSEADQTIYALSVLEEFVAVTWLQKLASSCGVAYPSVAAAKEPVVDAGAAKKRVKSLAPDDNQGGRVKRQRRRKTKKSSSRRL